MPFAVFSIVVCNVRLPRNALIRAEQRVSSILSHFHLVHGTNTKIHAFSDKIYAFSAQNS